MSLYGVACGTCMLCGSDAEVFVPDPEMARTIMDWRSSNPRTRPFVQDAFPMLTPGQRETILNGSHEACFDEAFPEEES